MLGSKVDIAVHVVIVGSVQPVRLGLGIVKVVELYGGQVESIRPLALAIDHLPPHADILHGLDPRCVLNLARLVEVQDEVRGQDVAGIVADHHRAPGRRAGSLQVALVALGIGREPRLKDHRLIIEVQVHTRVVYQGCLVDVDVEAVVGLHLERGLYASL